MSDTTTTLLTLPVLPLPSVVLPGTVVTISLDHEAARAAVEAAGRGDGRVVLTAPSATGPPAAPSSAANACSRVT